MKNKNVIALWTHCDLEYCEPQLKVTAHHLAKQFLHEFAIKSLRLNENQFEVRSNFGGPAVSGEVTLHTDPLPTSCYEPKISLYGVYIQIQQSALGRTVLWRSCNDRKDYSGHKNNWTDIQWLVTDNNQWHFVDSIRHTCRIPLGEKISELV